MTEQPDDWFDRLLAPASVAVVGATDDVRRPGGRVSAFLRRFGFGGRLYLVNPNRAEVDGVACVGSLDQVDEPVDVAVVLVAAGDVPTTIEECGRAGVKVAVVGSAGFSETGPAGEALEQRVAELCASLGIRMVGPNTNGVVVAGSRFAGSFTPALERVGLDLVDAPTAVVSQSGALGAALFALADDRGLPVGTLINTGNEADVTFEEVVEQLARRLPPGAVVLGYVEGLRDGGRFVAAARGAAARGVALVVLKVGRTEAGAQAAAAHTAKLAGDDRVYDGVLRQVGAVRAQSIDHLVDVGRLLRTHPGPLGRRVTVASLSGGLGIILTDLLERAGLEMARWGTAAQDQFDGVLPSHLSRHNPIDLAGGPFYDTDKLVRVLEAMDAHPGSDVSILAVANFDRLGKEIGEVVVTTAARLDKPLLVVWLGNDRGAPDVLNRGGVPCFAGPEACVAALASVVGRLALRPSSPPAPRRLTRRPGSPRRPHRGLELLAHYGIDVVDEVSAPVDGPLDIGALPPPWAVKLDAVGLDHKSEAGAVRLGVTGDDGLRRTVAELAAVARSLGLEEPKVVVQHQVDPGVELLLGMTSDPTFGPVVTFGLGGFLAEVLADVAVRLPDLEEPDVDDMLGEWHHAAVVAGFRHLPPVTPGRVSPLVLRFARLVREEGHRFRAIDLNPVILPPSGPPVAVDSLFLPLA